MLTGDEIIRMWNAGRIHIKPFEIENVNPNSYDLTLGGVLAIYEDEELDMKKNGRVQYLRLPPEGRLLQPGELYLGSTIEECGSDEFATLIEGRSSVARLGILVHLTAGFGDLGFKRKWTLEITVQKPVRVYSGVKVCQAVFQTTVGSRTRQYKGKYVEQEGPTPSKMYEDFKETI